MEANWFGKGYLNISSFWQHITAIKRKLNFPISIYFYKPHCPTKEVCRHTSFVTWSWLPIATWLLRHRLFPSPVRQNGLQADLSARKHGLHICYRNLILRLLFHVISSGAVGETHQCLSISLLRLNFVFISARDGQISFSLLGYFGSVAVWMGSSLLIISQSLRARLQFNNGSIWNMNQNIDCRYLQTCIQNVSLQHIGF